MTDNITKLYWNKLKEKIEKTGVDKELKVKLFNIIDYLSYIYDIFESKDKSRGPVIDPTDWKSLETLIALLRYTGPPVYCVSETCGECILDLKYKGCIIDILRELIVRIMSSNNKNTIKRINNEITYINNKYNLGLGLYTDHHTREHVPKEKIIEALDETIKELESVIIKLMMS